MKVEVWVVSDREPMVPLAHDVWHSPSGFEWGYSGSGPADLARSLCKCVLGYVPTPKVYQFVKNELIAGINDDNWTLPASRVLDSIARALQEAR